jgi:Glucodextranase, domain B
MGSLQARLALGITLMVLGSGACAAAAAATPITASNITSPSDSAELFYSGDNGSGSLEVTGTVSPAGAGPTADLYCYTSADTAATEVASGIDVSSGQFGLDVSLSPVAGQACRLRLVPAGTEPTGGGAGPFQGPRISVSDQFSHSTNGNLYGYYILSGILPWSFAFDSAGDCPILSSFATDPLTLYSFSLFAGNGCLPRTSGIAPALKSRSALQIDGLNAYPPAAIAALTGVAGFEPLTYTTTFSPAHDTVTINESDIPTICNPPGGYTPTPANCPSLHDSGIVLSQTTTLLPGGQVARVAQRFQDVDRKPHTIDLLFGQSVQAPTAGELPGFQFPGQSGFASHAVPDSYSLFSGGANSIIVVSDSAATPGTANPIGAITYSRPPASADFVSSAGAQTATFDIHYTDSIPAGGSVSYNWSYSQAADAAGLMPLVQIERDRFAGPTIAVTAPRQNQVLRANRVTVHGRASDLIGITSVSVAGHGVSVGQSGGFQASVRLRLGKNQIPIMATNVAGVLSTATLTVTYRLRQCVVPRLRGKLLPAAKRAIRHNLCAIGKVTRVRSRTIAAGHVISSTPEAGRRRAHGAKVSVVVSRGR